MEANGCEDRRLKRTQKNYAKKDIKRRVVASRDESVPWGIGDAAPPRISEIDQDEHPQVKVETAEIREFN